MTVYFYSKTDKDTAAFRLGWRRAFGKLVGGIFLFPSEATSFVVQWAPDLKISCKIPATTRNLKLNYLKKSSSDSLHDVEMPETILTQVIKSTRYHRDKYCTCRTCSQYHPSTCYCEKCYGTNRTVSKADFSTEFYLYTDHAEDMIHPFLTANIFDDGRICWGGQRKPPSLRQAHGQLWSSEFNNDFGRVSIIHSKCKEARHVRPRTCFKGKSGSHYEGCRRLQKHTCNCIDKTSHRWDCPCEQGLCYCKCECACCTQKCQCICNCNCCTGRCGCGCSCDFNKQFAGALSDYCDIHRRPPSRVYSTKQTLCGDKFIASTTKMAGVFVSYSPKFISMFPKRLHEKNSAEIPMIVGLARPKDEGWEVITRSGEAIVVWDREVRLV